MEYLIESKERAVSVSDIASHMKEQHCSVNVTTIYRYLDKLEKDGNHVYKRQLPMQAWQSFF